MAAIIYQIKRPNWFNFNPVSVDYFWAAKTVTDMSSTLGATERRSFCHELFATSSFL